MKETGDENRKTIKNILAPWGSWWVFKSHVDDEKPSNPVMEDWGGKPDKKSIDKKLLELNEEIWEKNQKIISLMKKPSNLDLEQGKKDQRWDE